MYWKWNKAIPKRVCKELIREVNTDGYITKGAIGDSKGKVDTSVRDCGTFFLPQNHWFEGILYNHVRYANQSAGWNFNIEGCQAVQFTEYKENQKYVWHKDFDFTNHQINNIGEYRKLTAVCQLTEASDFEGGGLFIKGEENSLLTDIGDVVVFPSFLEHKAETVTKGKRITAVLWAFGKPFV